MYELLISPATKHYHNTHCKVTPKTQIKMPRGDDLVKKHVFISYILYAEYTPRNHSLYFKQ